MQANPNPQVLFGQQTVDLKPQLDGRVDGGLRRRKNGQDFIRRESVLDGRRNHQHRFGDAVIGVEQVSNLLGGMSLAPGGEIADVHEHDGALLARQRQGIRVDNHAVEQVASQQPFGIELELRGGLF